MIIVLLLMLAGILLGTWISRYPKLVRINNSLTNYAIYLLLFLLGISVGLNEKIINKLDQIGIQSLIITIGAISGSVLVLALISKYAFKSGISAEKNNEK